MLKIMFAAIFVTLTFATPAEARRVALLIGQDAYPGGKSATVGLRPLANPGRDVSEVAALLAKHGFDIVSCDGKKPGCFDLKREELQTALDDFRARAKDAATALVYFAGHGMASEAGNILTPIDAKVDCNTGAITHGIEVERFMAATELARHKLVILDACRNNPIGDVCPNLKGKKLSFTRIEAGAMQNLLLVTSTQFGQEALDGDGVGSPFALALLAGLGAHPNIYFEQVMNEVGRATYQAAIKPTPDDPQGFPQIPGKVVGTPAPADCLAGKDCVGDSRMAALAQENERLTADASAVRNILADEERQRGKPYTQVERQAAVERIGRSLTSLAGSAEPKVQEASRLFSAGKVVEGRAKLDEALDDDEKAASEIERLAKERRKTLARNARDAADLTQGSDIIKALTYYERATRNDPEDAQTWGDYARAAVDAGRLDVAKGAFEQAALKARDNNEPQVRYWATLGLGDVAMAQGSLPGARRLYETAVAIGEPLAKADPGNAGWQRDLSVSHDRIGNVLVAQGNLPQALDAFQASLAIAERLAKVDPSNAEWQRDLSVSHDRIGDVLVAQGNLPQALDAFRASHAIFDRLAKADPGNAGWQRDLSVSQERIGDVVIAQGNLPQALDAFQASLAIRDRLTKVDPGNAEWQRDLSVSHDRIGDVLVAQGNLPQALDAFRASHAIFDRLAKADPGNAGWQYDLGISNERLGELLSAQGDLASAIKHYQARREIIERLAKADPGNAGWQRDLSVSQERIGDVLIAQGNLPQALDAFQSSLAIRDRLTKVDPGNAGWQRDLSISQGKVGDVLVEQGNFPAALAAFKASHAIFDRLAEADPGNAGRQSDLSASHFRLGEVLESMGKPADALKHHRRSLDIDEQLTKRDPNNATWQSDVKIGRRNVERLEQTLKKRK